MHLIQTEQVSAALDAIGGSISSADNELEKMHLGDEWASPGWHLELAYSQLLALAEALQLPLLRRDIAADLKTARADDLDAYDLNPEEEPYLKWGEPARRHLRTLQTVFGSEPSRTVTKDLESILRAAVYSITDRRVFPSPPATEIEVHLRLEAVLKCVFPDLKHKPTITKPIKNFEPDTGIPSLGTLIEYKFVSAHSMVAQIADQLLADTRGYLSREWTSFIYVVYETQRFRAESEWRNLLRESGIGAATSLVVLSGEPRE